MSSLQGKVVVITGAAGGLGGSLCDGFANEECGLVLADKNATKLADSVSSLQQRGASALGVPTDLTDTGQIRQMLQALMNAYDRIDVLVNNAGLCTARSFWSLTEQDWDEVLNVNVKGLFFALQTAATHMRDRAGNDGYSDAAFLAIGPRGAAGATESQRSSPRTNREYRGSCLCGCFLSK